MLKARPSHTLGFDYLNNILWRIRIMEFILWNFRAKEWYGWTVFVSLIRREIASIFSSHVFLLTVYTNVEISHDEYPAKSLWHMEHCRVTTGSQAATRLREKQRKTGRLADRKATRGNIYVVKLCGQGPKAHREKQDKDLLNDNARIRSRTLQEQWNLWALNSYSLYQEILRLWGRQVIRNGFRSGVYWMSMAAILAVWWRGNLKFIMRHLARHTEHWFVPQLLQTSTTLIWQPQPKQLHPDSDIKCGLQSERRTV
jgi:hypothetical protein